jgi:DNA-binding GntR family transcriptional regulator
LLRDDPPSQDGARVTGKLDAIAGVRPLKSQSLDSEVADRIREMILDGQLAPGVHLVEAELAKALGVSQGTVRSGIRALVADGLVEYRQNRGVFVASFTASDAWEVYTLRNALEATAAEIAAHRIDDDGCRRLQQILARMNPTEKRLSSSALGRLDLELHQTIVDLSEHKRLSAAYRVLAYQTHLFMTLTGAFPHEQSEVFAQHKKLVDAICGGHAKRAAELAGSHNSYDGERLVASLTERMS